jgi:Tfp pilus assembly protein PilN
MRAVNLIPQEERRGGGPARAGLLSYFLLGALAAVLVGVTLLVLTGNQISDRKAEVARLKQESSATAARAESLRAFADFSAMQEERTATVTSLAQSRFDWERVLRELSLVLPDDVWLSTVSAKAPVSSSVATPPAAPATGAAVAATGLTLDGYTYSQPAVARLLTRLTVIPDLVNVQLQQSTLTKIGATPVVHFTIAIDVRKPGGGS